MIETGTILDTGSLPSDWKALPFDACIDEGAVERKPSVLQGSYKPTGRFPVVDQGSSSIAGYTDDGNLVHRGDLPIILFGDHTRIFKFLDFPFAAGADGTKLFRASEETVEPKFLYYALLHLDISSRGYNRHFKYLKEKTILVPDRHDEQQAIAAVLAKIQTAVEVQEKIVGTLKELKSAMMAKLFRYGLRGESASRSETRFGQVPQKWEIESLSEHAYVQTGVAKGRKIDNSSAIELPYLRVANVQDGYLDLSEIKTIRLRETEHDRYSLQVDDVLLTEGGDFDKLGRGYLWKGQIKNCVHQNHIFAVRTNRKTLLPEFFVYLVQSPYGKAYFLSVAHKTTNLACINSHKLKGFPILLPSLSEQHEIAAILTGIDQKIDQHTNKLETFKHLFSSILHLLMTGQVRVNHAVLPKGNE